VPVASGACSFLRAPASANVDFDARQTAMDATHAHARARAYISRPLCFIFESRRALTHARTHDSVTLAISTARGNTYRLRRVNQPRTWAISRKSVNSRFVALSCRREFGPQTQLRFIEYSTEIKTFQAFTRPSLLPPRPSRSTDERGSSFSFFPFFVSFCPPRRIFFFPFLRINAENGIQRAHFLLYYC